VRACFVISRLKPQLSGALGRLIDTLIVGGMGRCQAGRSVGPRKTISRTGAPASGPATGVWPDPTGGAGAESAMARGLRPAWATLFPDLASMSHGALVSIPGVHGYQGGHCVQSNFPRLPTGQRTQQSPVSYGNSTPHQANIPITWLVTRFQE